MNLGLKNFNFAKIVSFKIFTAYYKLNVLVKYQHVIKRINSVGVYKKLGQLIFGNEVRIIGGMNIIGKC